MRDCFLPADILLPDPSALEKWAVIACDQHTSDMAYWDAVYKLVGEAPSALHMILPEIFLNRITDEMISQVHMNMEHYLRSGLFTEIFQCYLYVERTLLDGSVRQGILGMVDLECYDFSPNSSAMVRATEQTVLERIPPRVAIRKDAALEFSHVIVFCDDPNRCLIESIAHRKACFPQLYDFDLMQGGGHISGWLIQKNDAKLFQESVRKYFLEYPDDTGILVADGNHSLVTAKRCYEMLPSSERCTSPARYAMVELENIHSPAIRFEPIHRLLTNVDTAKLLADIQSICATDGVSVTWICGTKSGKIQLKAAEHELPVAVLQRFLDTWLQNNMGAIDYIHEADALQRLASEQRSVGFLMPDVDKSELFSYVAAGHTLPRKTFSLGHAAEKRYYLEGRKIK